MDTYITGCLHFHARGDYIKPSASLKYSSAAPVTVTYTSKTLVLYRVVNPLVVEPALFHILVCKNAVLLRNNQAADCPLSRTLAPLTRLFFQPKPPWEVAHLNCCFRLSAPHGSLSFRGSQQFVGFSSTPFREYRTTSLEKVFIFQGLITAKSGEVWCRNNSRFYERSIR